MRIVIDTNVVASGIFFGGKPKRLLELVVSESMEAFVSDEIITEYQETLDELCSRYPRKPHQLPLNKIVSSMNIIRPTSQIKICRDPDDDRCGAHSGPGGRKRRRTGGFVGSSASFCSLTIS